MKEKIKTQIVFNQKLSGYLMLRGFVLVDMRPDTHGSGRNVFFFKDSPELHKAIDDYKNNQIV